LEKERTQAPKRGEDPLWERRRKVSEKKMAYVLSKGGESSIQRCPKTIRLKKESNKKFGRMKEKRHQKKARKKLCSTSKNELRAHNRATKNKEDSGRLSCIGGVNDGILAAKSLSLWTLVEGRP